MLREVLNRFGIGRPVYNPWDIRESDLDGVRLTTIRAPGPKASAHVSFDSGAMEDFSRTGGTAHALEHLMFHDGDAPETDATVTAKKIGVKISGVTGFSNTIYSAEMLRARSRAGLELLAKVVQPKSFSDHAIEKEQRVIVRERRERFFINPGHQGQIELFANYFGGAQHFAKGVLGRESDIPLIRREDLTGYLGEHYVRENCRIIIRADATHEGMRRVAEKIFGNIPHGELPTKAFLHMPGGYNAFPLPSYQDVGNFITFAQRDDQFGPREMHLNNLVSQYFSNDAGPVMDDMRQATQSVYGIYSGAARIRANTIFDLHYISPPEESAQYTSRFVDHSLNLIEGNGVKEFFEIAHQNAIDEANDKMDNLYYPSGQTVWQSYENYGRIVSSYEERQALICLTPEDLVDHARMLMSQPATFFAYGNIEGGITRKQSEELIRPLTKRAASLLRKDR